MVTQHLILIETEIEKKTLLWDGELTAKILRRGCLKRLEQHW